MIDWIKDVVRAMLPNANRRSKRDGVATRKLVWRMDGLNPAGGFVDTEPTTMQAFADTLPSEAPASGWLMSSMDLEYGVDIVESESDLWDGDTEAVEGLGETNVKNMGKDIASENTGHRALRSDPGRTASSMTAFQSRRRPVDGRW